MNGSGLSLAEASERLRRNGPNEITSEQAPSRLQALWNQLRSPLQLLLFFAIVVAVFSGEWLNAGIVLAIVAASAAIGYVREYRAAIAVDALRSRIIATARVVRDHTEMTVPARDLVRGDLILLSAGNLVPADARIAEASDFHVNEAVLTGESFPIEKLPPPAMDELRGSSDAHQVFLGTNVRSGSARCIVTETGVTTRFGAIARHLSRKAPETEFDRGVRRFGYLIMGTALVMIVAVFAINTLLGRSPVDTLLFSVALAVGLSPELLPAILAVNLSRGAQSMAAAGVLVRRLNAMENLGSIDILCTDKTGTLTEGVVTLAGAHDPSGAASRHVLELGACNAALQTGLANPLDLAIRAAHPACVTPQKIAEIPYDFVRKRMSVIVSDAGRALLVTKGAVEPVLEACTQLADGRDLDSEHRAVLMELFHHWSEAGTRVLGVATRILPIRDGYSREDERQLQFCGFLSFVDRPKPGAAEAIRDLRDLGVAVKVITGDVDPVARHVAKQVGLPVAHVLTGKQLDEMNDEALWQQAGQTDLFAAVDPNQKERIILALRRMGHVVGFLGDGVNDAPAMHAADTSISVEGAVDVARDAADFILLERDLRVIRRGILEGRKTFANTLKYVLMTTSANLGNMISMAAASVTLGFLPLLAGQVLLNNFLSDVPAVGIANDDVDPELTSRPRRWSIRFIGRFMISFGLLSSLFDVMTFAALLGLFAASTELFRTAWFVESLLTEVFIVFVVRTRRFFWRSRPSTLLIISSASIAAVAVSIPYVPTAGLLGFVPLPFHILLAMIGITMLYVAVTELLKRRLYAGVAA